MTSNFKKPWSRSGPHADSTIESQGRRQFLKRLTQVAVAAPLLGSAALGRQSWARPLKVDDKPVYGKKNGYVSERRFEPDLPPWPHGGESSATDAMLMFRGNPAHTFYGTGPIPTEKPKVLWRHRMIDFESKYYGSDFVWRGTGWTGQPVVYAGYVWVGSQGRSMYCFDAKTGKVAWRQAMNRQIKGSACLWDNKIYVGNVDDWLRCLDARTGRVIWKIDTGRDLDSSPLVTGGKLYIAGENGYARCLDPNTGVAIWKTFVNGLNPGGPHPGSYGSETSPAVVDGTYYTATYDGKLFALDAETGAEKWVADTGDDTDSSPVVVDDLVYVAAEDKNPYVFAFSTKDGREVWRHERFGGYWATAAVDGDRLFIGAAGGNFDALDRRTGELLWNTRLAGGTWSSAAVVDGKVIVGDRSGYLSCLDAEDGRLIWKLRLTPRIHSTPAIVDGRIYIGSTSGWFYCIG